jgi:hypothetical protein
LSALQIAIRRLEQLTTALRFQEVNMKRLLIIPTLLLLLCATAAQGQDRFSIDFRGGAAFPTTDLGQTALKTGGGFGATASVRVLPHMRIYGGWDWTYFATDGAFEGSEFDVVPNGYAFGLQFQHPLRNEVYGWVRAGALYNHVELEDTSNVVDSGHEFGWELGTGLRVPLIDRMALTPGVRYRMFSADLEMSTTRTVPVDINFVSAELGLSFSFGAVQWSRPFAGSLRRVDWCGGLQLRGARRASLVLRLPQFDRVPPDRAAARSDRWGRLSSRPSPRYRPRAAAAPSHRDRVRESLSSTAVPVCRSSSSCSANGANTVGPASVSTAARRSWSERARCRMLFVPFRERLRIARAEEHATNAGHFSFACALPGWAMTACASIPATSMQSEKRAIMSTSVVWVHVHGLPSAGRRKAIGVAHA